MTDPTSIPPNWLDYLGHGGTIGLLTAIYSEIRSQRKRLDALETSHKLFEDHDKRIKKLAKIIRQLKGTVGHLIGRDRGNANG